MGVSQYVGYWVGTFEGTNQGGLTADIREDRGALVGTAKFSEPAHGQYEYSISAVSTDPLVLKLVPTRVHGAIQLGQLQIVGALQPDNSLAGKWRSSIGTEGVFSVKRAQTAALAERLPSENSVFLVHGQDEGAKQGVARFLEQLGIRPVILQEQINRGMTVIEKFEDFAKRAGFAVVLMTPDDFGYAVNREQEKRYRARQNVVLELGYFAAKLGRDKTFVLTKGDVEIPSDILGIVYQPMDSSEGWKMRLARELKAAGFQIDLNRSIA